MKTIKVLLTSAAAAILGLGAANAQEPTRPSTDLMKYYPSTGGPGVPGAPIDSPARAGNPSVRNLKQSSLEISNLRPGPDGLKVTAEKNLIVGATFTIVDAVKRDLHAIATVVDADGKPVLKKDGSPLQASYAIKPLVFTQGDGKRFAIPLDEIAAALGGTEQFRVAVNIYDAAAAKWLAEASLEVSVDLAKLRPAPRKANPGPAGEDIVGTWTIAATKQLFDLKIASITGNRIWYTTSFDSTPRLGLYNQLTGSLEFTHTDRDGVLREFGGNVTIKGDAPVLAGTSRTATGDTRKDILSGQVFGGTFSK